MPGAVAHPPRKPLVIFDGECGICRRSVDYWRRQTGEAFEYLPLQSGEVAARFPEVPRAALEAAVHLIETDGRVTCAAEAVFRARALAGRTGLGWYRKVPGFAGFAEWAYRRVARNRRWISRVTGSAATCGVAPAPARPRS